MPTTIPYIMAYIAGALICTAFLAWEDARHNKKFIVDGGGAVAILIWPLSASIFLIYGICKGLVASLEYYGQSVQRAHFAKSHKQITK